MQHLLGVDTGGTFTDFVYLVDGRFRVHKVLSTPDSPARAIEQGINDLGLRELASRGALKLIHGTTVATNATLESKGVKTAYITNTGLADVLLIGRQTRTHLYDLNVRKATPPLSDALTFEVDARLAADGTEVKPLTDAMLAELKSQVESCRPEAIAINLLFSFLNDQHERVIEALFEDRYFVSRSSFVLPEYREYERGITTWVNAWIGPLIREYMLSVKQILAPSPVSIMQSSGITIAADQAARRAVNLLLSGPAGGIAASRLIQKSGLLTFDMGGTSTDVSLLTEESRLTNEASVAGYPISVPMADIHTIGAGGGSIASVDQGGLLQVGPRSAGASPGPACYGLGGSEPTVTDANLVLGRLRPNAFLGGTMTLDVDAARRAFQPLAEQLSLSIEQAAQGVIAVANEHMTQALRYISIQRGQNPSDFTLICFGGAGGLHLCALAEAMSIHRAIIPVMSGVLSALGMLATKPGRELVRTQPGLLAELTDAEVVELLNQLASQGDAELGDEGITAYTRHDSLDLRYAGQSFTLNVAYTNRMKAIDDFHAQHSARYGHSLDKPVELVNVRIHLEAESETIALPEHSPGHPGKPFETTGLFEMGDDVPAYRRESLKPGQTLEGPALIIDEYATSLIQGGWQAEVDRSGNLVLTDDAT